MNIRLLFIFALQLLMSSNDLLAAARAHDATGIARLQTSAAGRATISLDRATGTVRFLRLEPGALRVRAASPAMIRIATENFLAEHASVFGLRNPATELELVREMADGFGYSHVLYRQVFEGVPVFGSDFRTHFDRDGALTAVTAVTVPIRKLDPVPGIRASAASEIAIARVAGVAKRGSPVSSLTALDPELLVFRTGLLQGVSGSNHLAYRVEVFNSARTVREFVFIDAHTGVVLDQITGIQHVLDRRVYNGGFQPQFLRWSEGDALPYVGNNATGINNLIEYAEDTYNLFLTLSNGTYPSYDGSDAVMNSVLNDPALSCPNARWSGTFTSYCNNVTGDDTVAHEWGHAYTQYTHGLIYQWQSGALNESYSDIFGEIVDLLNGAGTDSPITPRAADGSACSVFGDGNPSTDNSYLWLSGEDDPAFNAGRGIRDMWRPECFGHPGRVTSGSYFCSTADGGGVHFNSGIPNHGFALMVDGGTYNGEAITGLGLTKATHIYWRAMTAYQGPASNFSDHANAISQSCTDLLGINLPALSTDTTTPSLSGIMIDAADCTEVDKIINAVEFHTEPVQCNFQPLLENNPPVRCEGYGSLQSFSFTDWETGLGSWTVGTHDVFDPATFDTPDWTVVGDLPDGRPGMAAFVPDLIIGDCVADDETGALNLDSPLIEIPAGTQVPRISVDHNMSSESGWDGGNFKISINGGTFSELPPGAIEVSPYNASINTTGQGNTNPLQGQPGYTGADGGSITGSWGQTWINLLGLVAAGDTVQLRVDFGVDGCNGAVGWYIDDVEFYACSAELPPSNCGNSILDTGEGEQCDDGNDFIGDGCSNRCRIETGWACTLPRAGIAIQDPGFEAGTPNPFWAESSTVFGTPLCDAVSCGTGPGIGPSEGSWWAWFGGISGTFEEGSVSQSVTVATGATEFNFDFMALACDSPADFVELRIDGNQEFLVDGASPLCGVTVYSTQSVDVSAYADGGSHVLNFRSVSYGANGGTANFFVDGLVAPVTPSVCTLTELPIFIHGFESTAPPPTSNRSQEQD